MSQNKADVNQRDTTIFILCMPVLAHSKHHIAEDITSAKLFCVLPVYTFTFEIPMQLLILGYLTFVKFILKQVCIPVGCVPPAH